MNIDEFLMWARLTRDALPTSDDEEGSERQVDAENLFFHHIEGRLSPADAERLYTYGLKATCEERIGFALQLLGLVTPESARRLNTTKGSN